MIARGPRVQIAALLCRDDLRNGLGGKPIDSAGSFPVSPCLKTSRVVPNGGKLMVQELYVQQKWPINGGRTLTHYPVDLQATNNDYSISK